jgi:predicted ArsR family transcriptional regulator
MTADSDVDDQPDWAAYQNLTPTAQTCLLLVANYDGDAWRGLIAQAAQDGLDVSDRHVRRSLADLESTGLIESSEATQRRETYSVTDDGREVLVGIRDSLAQTLETISE